MAQTAAVVVYSEMNVLHVWLTQHYWRSIFISQYCFSICMDIVIHWSFAIPVVPGFMKLHCRNTFVKCEYRLEFFFYYMHYSPVKMVKMKYVEFYEEKNYSKCFSFLECILFVYFLGENLMTEITNISDFKPWCEKIVIKIVL